MGCLVMNKKPQELATLSDDAQIQHQLTVLNKAQLQINEEILGKGVAFDLDLLVTQITVHLVTANIAMYEVGKCLTALKNNISPSAYRDVLQNRIGTEPRYAQRAIRIYDRFKSGRRPELVTQMNQAQLLVLMHERDEDLDTLAEGGELAGMDKDDLLNLSAKEVRAQLRKTRIKMAETQETADELVRVRDERIHKLQKRLDLGDKYPAAEKAGEMLADLNKASAALAANVATIVARVDQFNALLQDAELPEATVELFKAVARNAQMVSGQLHGLVPDAPLLSLAPPQG